MGSGTSTPKQKRPLIVLIDLGDVLSEFEKYFLAIYREKYPNEPYIPCDQRSGYDIVEDYQKIPGAGKHMKDIVESVYMTKGFTRDLPEIPGAIKAVTKMATMKGVDIFIVTSPPQRLCDYKSIPEKYEWIENHFGKDWIHKVIITRDKTAIEGDILIDDKVDITGDIERPSWDHVVFTSCPNKKLQLKGKTRLNNWTDGHWRTVIENYRNKLRQRTENLEEAGMSDVDEDEEDTPIIPKFKKKSSWNPPKSRNVNLESFINLIKSDVPSNSSNLKKHNLSRNESEALKHLQDKDEIVIKPADKGSAVVVMDKTDYIKEGERQLSDQRFYKNLDSDPTDRIIRDINSTLSEMREENHIDDDTHKYLIPENCKPGRFYLLPKLHKEGIPRRPIVSANDHPTEKVSEFVNFHLRPHVHNLPSFIQDTTDYLTKMETLSSLPPNTILATMDVSSLYTNIPQEEGISACEEMWNSRKDKFPPTECLVKLLSLVLKNNNFTFNGEHYLQIDGTSMGTKMAPSYANIFMGNLEQCLLSSAPHKPLSWFRFIDDIDIKWNDTEEHLQEFVNFCNDFHHSIKFTHESSKTKITFLDTTTTLENGTMTTDLHVKTTDIHQYLSPSSCHPKHCSRSIPYSQALRIKRICSTEQKQVHRLNELKKHLINRGYKSENITKSFEKAKTVERAQLLQYKDKSKTQPRIPLVVTYHPDLDRLSSVIRQHWNLIEKDPTLKKVFPTPPVMAFRRPKNIKDHLVKSSLDKRKPSGPGSFKSCGRSNCKCCKSAYIGSTFTSNVTNERYTIYCNTNCKSQNVIYLLECGTCGIQYVGETGDHFNMRLNNHRSFYVKQRDAPLTRHLRSKGHHFKDVKFTIIDQNPKWDKTARQQKEKFWIKKLKTLEPQGLNERD